MLTAWVCCCFHAHPSWQGSAASTVHGHWAVFPLLWSAVSFGLSSSVHTGRDDERHHRGEIKRNGRSEIQRQVQSFPGRHTTLKWIKSSHLGTKTPLFGLLWTLGHFSACVYGCVLTCVVQWTKTWGPRRNGLPSSLHATLIASIDCVCPSTGGRRLI